jgi:hypothetical protein
MSERVLGPGAVGDVPEAVEPEPEYVPEPVAVEPEPEDGDDE